MLRDHLSSRVRGHIDGPTPDLMKCRSHHMSVLMVSMSDYVIMVTHIPGVTWPRGMSDYTLNTDNTVTPAAMSVCCGS